MTNLIFNRFSIAVFLKNALLNIGVDCIMVGPFQLAFGHRQAATSVRSFSVDGLQTVVGFHQDEHADWVAELSCGHTQHVRHSPPWMLRPWVTSAEGRNEHLGMVLRCRKCSEET